MYNNIKVLKRLWENKCFSLNFTLKETRLSVLKGNEITPVKRIILESKSEMRIWSIYHLDLTLSV
jgi:hypothetical protein